MKSHKQSNLLTWCMGAMFGLFIVLSLAGPFALAHAEEIDPTEGSLNLVPCGRIWDKDAKVWIEKPCEFLDLIVLFHNVIRAFFIFLMLTLGFLIVRLGFKYLNSGGSVIRMQEAKKGFKHLAIGLLIMICAWGIYEFVLENILDQNVIKNPTAQTSAQ